MRIIFIIIVAVIITILITPLIRIVTLVEWDNNCMVTYVASWEKEWVQYNIWWYNHIWSYEEYLESFIVWKADWCMMKSNRLFSDIINTIYCYEVKLIK